MAGGPQRRPSGNQGLGTAVAVIFCTLLYLSWLRSVAHSAARSRLDTPVVAAPIEATAPPSTHVTVAATSTIADVQTPLATTSDAADDHRGTKPLLDVLTERPRTSEPTPTPSPHFGCPRHGVDIKDTKDNRLQAHPGGTEVEARSFRRQIAKYQWPNVRALSALRWRTLPTEGHAADDRDDAAGVLGCLQASQHTLPLRAQHELWHHRAQSEHHCETTNFACRIAAYRTVMPHGAVPHNAMCDRVYGMGLIERLRAADKLLCSSSGTTVHCRMTTVHSTHDVETSVCRVDRGAVDFSRINHGDYPWLQFEKGALTLSCTDTADGTRVQSAPDRYFLHCLADWMRLGYRSVDAPPPNHQQSATTDDDNHCDAFVDTPTLFVTRSGDYSPFALTHDWINAVVLMATEGLRPEDLQVVIMDRMGVGFYTPVWQVAFAPSRPLQWYPDIHDDDDMNNPARKKQPPRICYRKMYFNIPARLSPIYNEDECGAERPGAYTAPLYHVYRDHLLHTFNALHTVGGVATPDGHAPRLWDALVVTIIMRRNYATGHSIGRRIANADALTAALRREMAEIRLQGSSGHTNDGGAAVALQVVVHQTDFAAFDFDQQLNISRATDVLVAMHGAGLAQMMFMHPWGGVFEFFCVEKPSSNYRYHQLANKMGLVYDAYSIANENNEVRIDEVMPQLLRLGQRVAELKRDALRTSSSE